MPFMRNNHGAKMASKSALCTTYEGRVIMFTLHTIFPLFLIHWYSNANFLSWSFHFDHEKNQSLKILQEDDEKIIQYEFCKCCKPRGLQYFRSYFWYLLLILHYKSIQCITYRIVTIFDEKKQSASFIQLRTQATIRRYFL